MSALAAQLARVIFDLVLLLDIHPRKHKHLTAAQLLRDSPLKLYAKYLVPGKFLG